MSYNNGYNQLGPQLPTYGTPLPAQQAQPQPQGGSFQQYLERNNNILEVETKSGKYSCLPMENKCVFTEFKQTFYQRKNNYGGPVNTQKNNFTNTDICSFIWIDGATHYANSYPGKEGFYLIYYFSTPTSGMEVATVTESAYKSENFYSKFNNLTPFSHKIKKTNEMLRLITEERIKTNTMPKYLIPARCGWYLNNSDLRFISYNNYFNIDPSVLPDTIRSYLLPPTEEIKFVFANGTVDYDLIPIQKIFSNILTSYLKSWQAKFLFTMRAACLFLFMFEQVGLRPKQFILPIISNSDQADYLTSLLKTHDPEVPSAISLNADEGALKKELFCAQDGIVVIKAFLDSKALNNCTANLSTINNALNLAYTSDKDTPTRQIIAIISRSLFEAGSGENILPIDCSDIKSDIDNTSLRNDLRLFDATLIKYIKLFYEPMKATVMRYYKVYADASLSTERNSLLVIFNLTLALLGEHLGIDLFTNEERQKVEEMFHCDIRDYKTCYQMAVEEFSDIVCHMIENNEVIIIDKADVKTDFKPDCKILIYTPAEQLLSFEPSLIERIATSSMKSVRSRDELINSLNKQEKLKKIDHNGHHIRIPTEQNPENNPFFYGIRADIFGDIISESICKETDSDYFMSTDEVPDKIFLPLVWNNNKAAGIVTDDFRNMNLHTLITGNSGKGKSFKMCRLAEYYHAIGAKVIFIDTSNSFNREQLKNLHAKENDYHIIEARKDTLPFNIFDLSAFGTSNEKKMYLLNIIKSMGGKAISHEREKELSERLQEVTDSSPARTSFEAILNQDNKSRRYALKNILEQFSNVFGHYSYADISCNNYINNMDKINILSFGQITGSDMSIIVFSLLESIFQHRVNDHAVPVVLLADEMQRYDELFETNPFAKILNEGRSNNIIAIGSTLEYGGTGRKVSKIFSKANIQVFFQPTIDSSKRVKNDVGESVSAEKIRNLDKHQCIVKAEFYNKRTQKSETTILLGDSHSEVKLDIKRKYRLINNKEIQNNTDSTSNVPTDNNESQVKTETPSSAKTHMNNANSSFSHTVGKSLLESFPSPTNVTPSPTGTKSDLDTVKSKPVQNTNSPSQTPFLNMLSYLNRQNTTWPFYYLPNTKTNTTSYTANMQDYPLVSPCFSCKYNKNRPLKGEENNYKPTVFAPSTNEVDCKNCEHYLPPFKLKLSQK